MNEVRQLLARNMKRCREAMSLSQENLADRVGCSPTFIANIEIGKRFPSAGNLDRIAEALSVHPSELFRGEATSFLALGTPRDIRRIFETEVLSALDRAEAKFDEQRVAR